jgi:hypothetical protein
VPLRFTFGPGLYGSLFLSIAAIMVGAFFGGRVENEAHVPPSREGSEAAVPPPRQETSKGKVLH